MAAQAPNPDMFTAPFQLTAGMHRAIYPAVDPTSPSNSAKGKVVIITGASGGIGYATAQAWSLAGAAGIVLAGRTEAKLEEVAAELKVPSLVVKADVTVEAEAKMLIEKAVEKFGKVDALVTTAYSTVGGGNTGEVEVEEWWAGFESNIRGVYNTAHYFIRATGGKGAIVNLVTLGASFLVPRISAYSTSKLAVIKLGEYLDLEHPSLRVFSLHPGIVEAVKGRGTVIDQFTPFAKDQPSLAGAVTLWLQRPEAEFLSGGYLSVNWDVEELVAHKDEITDKQLTKLGFLKGELGVDGYAWRA